MPAHLKGISQETAEVYALMGIPYVGYVEGIGYQSLMTFTMGSCYFQKRGFAIPVFQTIIDTSQEEYIKSMNVSGDDLIDRLVQFQRHGSTLINMGHGNFREFAGDCEIIARIDDGIYFSFGYREHSTGKEEIIKGKLTDFEVIFGDSFTMGSISKNGEIPMSEINTVAGGTPWYSIYNWPALGSSARTMDALYAGNYLEAGIQFATCAAEVFTFGYASEINLGVNTVVGSVRIPVYRVYGGASRINGGSWTPINPKLFPSRMFRKYAGLPDVNWSNGYIKGSVKFKDIILYRRALPLDGNIGGLPEVIINPNNVNMWKYMNRPGLYNSYWGY